MHDDDAILQDFIEEANEHLQTIESDLLQLEEDGSNLDLVNKVFRAAHSIKGAAGFLELHQIQDLTHAQENLLNMIRNDELATSSPVINALLSSFDLLQSMLSSCETSNDVDISGEVAKLETASSGGDSEASLSIEEEALSGPAGSVSGAQWQLQSPCGDYSFTLDLALCHQLVNTGFTLYMVNTDPSEFCDNGLTRFLADLEKTGKILANQRGETSGTEPFGVVFATLLEPAHIDSLIPFGPEKVESLTPPEAAEEEPEPIVEAAPPPAPPKPVVKEVKPAAAQPAVEVAKETTIRVKVTTLDRLMNLAGELVLGRNQLSEVVRSAQFDDLGAAVQKLDTITSDLQLSIMSTRMQPIGKVFTKFTRIVRDLAQNLEKNIHLNIEGKDVELDKTIVEAIGDPLTHLIRNAVDHGLETPAERRKVGKPAEATIDLKAFYEAGQVVIEVTDDGRGIDPDRISQKVLEKGLMDQETLDRMPCKDIVKLIFHPGFSTVEQVTEISGRGVGMDVVNTAFTALGGIIDLESVVGVGTTVRIKLPLTLAIIPSLMTRVGGQKFAVPQANLIELVRIPPNKMRQSIQRVGEQTVLRRRGALVPLVSLRDVLDMQGLVFRHPETGEVLPDRRASGHLTEEDEHDEERRRSPLSATHALLLDAGELCYALLVDEFLGSEEIVVKPLGSHLSSCPYYTGATIEGSGRVALILDVLGIAKILNLKKCTDASLNDPIEEEDFSSSESETLLVVRNGGPEQFAVPLALIDRLEQIERDKIHTTAGRDYVIFRDESLPLFRIGEVANVGANQEDELCYILVTLVEGKEVGLVVSDIADVVQSTAPLDSQTFKQPGIIGSVVINDEATLVIDIRDIVLTVYPDWCQAEVEEEEERPQGKVLVVDDSRFYRTHIGECLKQAGCDVEVAEDGIEALEKLHRIGAQNIRMVFTDIEMPNLDGFGLTEAIRKDPQLQHLPVVAITSQIGQEKQEQGKRVGLDDYLIKLDKQKILSALHQFSLKLGV